MKLGCRQINCCQFSGFEKKYLDSVVIFQPGVNDTIISSEITKCREKFKFDVFLISEMITFSHPARRDYQYTDIWLQHV